MRDAQYGIIDFMSSPDQLVIIDIGPWHIHSTITNSVELVVDRLVSQCLLPAGRRLFYYDSEGELAEILIRDGMFAGFASVTDLNEKASSAATNEATKGQP
ncbi:MAG: hypothetical protein IT393_07160 [Nitrospirae bacterium]|nr:hypothetical protein [Nitrospirota bacterium]